MGKSLAAKVNKKAKKSPSKTQPLSTDFSSSSSPLAFQKTPQTFHFLCIILLSQNQDSFHSFWERRTKQIITPKKETMAISDNSRQSLLPSFLYSTPSSTKRLFGLDTSLTKAINHHHVLPRSPSVSSSSNVIGDAGVTASRIVIPSPKEGIEMYSPAFYAACTAGGTLSCGLTHTALTPLDVVKCNMQVFFLRFWAEGFWGGVAGYSFFVHPISCIYFSICFFFLLNVYSFWFLQIYEPLLNLWLFR